MPPSKTEGAQHFQNYSRFSPVHEAQFCKYKYADRFFLFPLMSKHLAISNNGQEVTMNNNSFLTTFRDPIVIKKKTKKNF